MRFSQYSCEDFIKRQEKGKILAQANTAIQTQSNNIKSEIILFLRNPENNRFVQCS